MSFARTSLIAALAAGAASLAVVPASASWAGVQHSHSSRVSSGSAHSAAPAQRSFHSVAKSPALASGYCEVASGLPGDAFPEVGSTSPQNMDSLDITDVGAQSSGTTLTFQIKVTSLHSRPDQGPMIYGRADVWQVTFLAPDGNSGYAELEYPGKADPSNPAVFTPYADWGELVSPPAGSGVVPQFRNILGTGTGTVDSSTDRVTFSIPLGVFKGHSGSSFGSPSAVGVMVTSGPRWVQPDPNTPPTTGVNLKVDTGVSSVADYVIGKGCVSVQS